MVEIASLCKSHPCWSPSVYTEGIILCPWQICSRVSLKQGEAYRQLEASYLHLEDSAELSPLCGTWKEQELWGESAKAQAAVPSAALGWLLHANHVCGLRYQIPSVLHRDFCGSNDKGMRVSGKAGAAIKFWMATAHSTIAKAKSRRNSLKRKINLSNSLGFWKGRFCVCVCVLTLQERYSDNKMMADL